jgi:hypothetical protein
MPSFAGGGGGRDEGQLALEERRARRSDGPAPVVCAYARGVYDGVQAAVTLTGGRRPRPAGAPPTRLARADGLAFREVPLPRP